MSRSPECSSTYPGFPSQAISQFCSGASAASQSDPGTTVCLVSEDTLGISCLLLFFFGFFFLCQITLIEPTQPDLAKINTPNPGCKRSNGSQTTNGGRKRRAPWGTGRPTGGHTTQSEAKWIRRAPSDMEVTSVAVELMAPSRFPKQPLLHRPLLLSSPVSVSLSTSNLSVFSALGPPPSSARPQPATSSHQQSNHRLKCRCPFIATSCI